MCLELTAALFALNTLVSDERGMHAGRNLDNTMTVACINNSGTNYSFPVQFGNKKHLEVMCRQEHLDVNCLCTRYRKC